MTVLEASAEPRHPLDTLDCRGAPLLLLFGAPAASGESLAHAGLFWTIARRRKPPCGLVFVHDRKRSGFYRGATGFGTSIDEVEATLRTMIERLEPSTIVTCGEGIGGHAALVFGILLGASRIVALEPPSHLVADELARYHDGRWQHALAELPAPALARRFDVSSLIAARGFRGRALILFGTRRGRDGDHVHQNLIHAHRLARSDRVVLQPFPDVEHGVLDALVHRGEADAILTRALFEVIPATPAQDGLDAARLRITSKRYQSFKYQVCQAEDASGLAISYAAAGEVGPATSTAFGVDDEWRTWIAENLMLGASPKDIEETLIGQGIAAREAALEVSRAMLSPYLWGARRLKDRLKKREWLLAVYRKLQRLPAESAAVVRRHRPSRGEFLARHRAVGRPVILTGLLDDVPAWDPNTLERRFDDLCAYLRPAREYLEEADEPPESTLCRPSSGSSCPPLALNRADILLAQVLGTTRFRIAPSWDVPLLRPTRDEMFSELDDPSLQANDRPAAGEPQLIDGVLAEGEALFLPAGWWASTAADETSVSVAFTAPGLQEEG